MVILKSPLEIKKIRKSNQIVADILSILESKIEPGVDTKYLDNLAEKLALERSAKPAFKGYKGFPYSVCVSPNSTIVHGFPSKKPLKEGDIISIDFGVLFEDFYGDSAITVPVGNISPKAKKLVNVTKEALHLGIKKAKSGARLSDISHAIQKHAEKAGFSVVRQFVGHGIGRTLHEEPQIPNFGKPGTGIRLTPGMTLAIEPMINEKGSDAEILDDGWTAVTIDGGLSAHFEHTIAITEKGPEILSKRNGSCQNG